MNIELLLEDFCYQAQHIRGVSKSTLKRYRQNVSNFIRATQIRNTKELCKKILFDFFAKGRAEKKWKATTFRTYYMSLLVFFRWCTEHGYLQENYLEDFALPKLEKALPKKIKKQEALRLLDVAYNYPYTQAYLKYRNHAIFTMFLFAGLRKNELLHLKMTDVDTDNRTIFIRMGKGGKDRIVPMNHVLAQSLSRYLYHRKKARKTCPEFFTSSNRNGGFTESGLKHLTERLKKASGIAFSIHKLRHTFATLMLEGGCDIYSLSKMMGHSDIKTTTIYLSASAEHLRGQMTKHPLNDLVH